MKSLAVTVGCFDLLHHGHLNLFKKMRFIADEVCAGVHDDASILQNKQLIPHEGLDHRLSQVDLHVDYSFTIDQADPSESLVRVIQDYKKRGYDVCYVRGDDWLQFPGRSAVEALDIPIFFIPYTKGVSSTELRERL